MLFINLVLAFVVGSLVSSGLMLFIMFKLMSSPKVIEWYINWFKTTMENIEDTMDEIV